MIESLAWDASKNMSIDVTVMVDETLAPEDAPQLPKDSTIQSVSCGCDIELLLEIAPHFDHIIFIAPETQGVLMHALQEIEDAGFEDGSPTAPYLLSLQQATSTQHAQSLLRLVFKHHLATPCQLVENFLLTVIFPPY